MSVPEKKLPPAPNPTDSLSVELGSWFKAHATGRGVLAIPLVVAVVVVAALVRMALG